MIPLAEAGMTPLQAIEAATANAPLTLGPQAPKSGQLKAGYDADILVVRKDPVTALRLWHPLTTSCGCGSPVSC